MGERVGGLGIAGDQAMATDVGRRSRRGAEEPPWQPQV